MIWGQTKYVEGVEPTPLFEPLQKTAPGLLQHLSYFEPVNLGQDGKMFTEEAEHHVRPNLCTEMLLSYLLSHSMNDS